MASVKHCVGIPEDSVCQALCESSRVLRLSKNEWEFLKTTSVKSCLVLEDSVCLVLCANSGV